MLESAGRKLRDVSQQGTLQVPGVPFALAARLVESLGFRAGYFSGGAFSAGLLGMPDIGLFTLTELAQAVAAVTRVCGLPLIVDADTGFGEAVNVERTVGELERAGAAAIQLEDQQLPKRCGHLSGKSLVTADAMCAKIRAAAAARRDEATVILARTDARGVEGLEAAVARARQYVEAGADWIFPEALQSRDEFQYFARQLAVPLVANMTEFGQSPLLTLADLAAMNYRIVLYPVSLLRLAMRSMETGLRTLQAEGTQATLLDAMQTREQLYRLLDYQGYEARDRDYFGRPPQATSEQ